MIKIKVPTELNDLTLGQYQKYIAIENPTEVDLIKCFMGYDEATINKIDAKSVKLIAGEIANVLKKDAKELEMKCTIGDTKLGMIPDLDSITYGENKDLVQLLDGWENMHLAMAVLYRPIKHEILGRYTIDPYESLAGAEAMKQMPLGTVFSAMVFFWSLTKELLRVTPKYLEKQMGTDLAVQTNSAASGTVIKSLLHLLTETLQKLEKLLN
jgi:hypothetical protein